MSETILRKKKKTDYELLRKLEDAYDEAEVDLKSKEEILIKSVHKAYLDAENKGEFFKELHKSESWYRTKFRENKLATEFAAQSNGAYKMHQERKVKSIISDLEEMEKDIENKPFVEIDEEIVEKTDYVDPREIEKDWINRTKIEIQAEEPKKITDDSNFGMYQDAKTMIERCRLITKRHFNVSEKYRVILIHQLDKTITYLNELRRDLDND